MIFMMMMMMVVVVVGVFSLSEKISKPVHRCGEGPNPPPPLPTYSRTPGIASIKKTEPSNPN
jgi:hypothetical protein